MEFWWFFKIPFVIYCVVMIGLFLLSPTGSILFIIVTVPFVLLWWLFVRQLCREVEKSKKFNHRK